MHNTPVRIFMKYKYLSGIFEKPYESGVKNDPAFAGS